MDRTYFEPPSNISYRDHNKPSVFLAGSIEQGEAINWQPATANSFIEKGFVVFNPRRKDWDASRKQEFVDPYMYQQIGWEDNAMNMADHILIYLQPKTLSPIALFEFGKHLTSGKVIMVCPEGFWRKPNVDFECAKYNVPQFDRLTDAIQYITTKR